ncbi:extracellular solute-binding protein [Nocardioides sp.]|uniref:extracellular solute-binding protein n=1 Tax=Nocardioides sp. TaxID=35761 RepID=UPI002ED24519
MRTRWRAGRGVRLVGAVTALLVTAAALAGCEADSGAIPTPDESDGVPVNRTLTFAVFGHEEERAAYQSLVAVFNSLYDGAEFELESYGSREALMGTIRESGEVPDVFLTSGQDLAWLSQEQLLEPVDSLLLERGIDFGDVYSRDSVLAFSSEDRLLCMPVGISPMVLFYNTELVDFEKMALRELPVPTGELNAWDFEEFVVAAEFASRPRRGTRAIHVQPSIEGLAPFIYGGGGDVYNDPVTPTSLAFSSDGSRSALEQVLTVLRDPRLTLSDVELQRRSALEWFKRGKLAMIPGYRDLVPQLREVAGLQFDVIGMPAIERNATVGNITGMCVSAASGNATAAADFLVHMASSVSVRRVASEGYLVPANLEVALSPDFLQPGRAPDHALAFVNAIRTIVLPPLIDDEAQLELVVADSLEEMLTAPILTDLEELTSRIDQESRTVLDPEGLAEEEAEREAEEESESP